MQALWMPEPLTLRMVLIVVVGVFLASFVDGIAGGGGIISVPTYFLAGLGFVDWKLGIPSILLALLGSHWGTLLQLSLDEKILKWLLLIVLPIVAVVVLRQRQLPEERREMDERRRTAVVWLASFVVGGYDGFYGPGTGTFLLLIFCTLAGLDLRTASGNVKLVNLASNLGAVFTSLINGKVFLLLGLIGAVASVAGHYIGSGLAIKDGSRIVRPVVLLVLALLAVKVVSELFV